MLLILRIKLNPGLAGADDAAVAAVAEGVGSGVDVGSFSSSSFM